MKGDISAEFHAPEKRFSGVRAQAGRVLTDADFNAAFDVLDDQIETLVRRLICAAGSPDQGLKPVSAAPVTLPAPESGAIESFDVTFAPGSFLLGGRAFAFDQALSLVAQRDWLSRLLDPAALPEAPVEGRTDLVWIEATEAAVRAVEDRELQDVALSADTTTRLRPQLRLRVLSDVAPDCLSAAQTLAAELGAGGHALSADRSERLSAARLGLAFVEDGPGLDPCAPAGAAGYLGAENHMLKVMLTAPDRFVWAFDHGEPLYRIRVDASQQQIEFLTAPRDPMLLPLPGQVIEILPWDVVLPNLEKAAAPLGHLARLTGHFDPRSGRVNYDGSLPAAWLTWLADLPDALEGQDDAPPRFFYARLWQPPLNGAGPDTPTGAGLILPETGLALHFSGQGIAGDYWSVALRPDAPQRVHPWVLRIDPGAGEAPQAPPMGPRRFQAPLGLITWRGAAQPVIEDCRNRFRSLCRIKGCCTYQVGDGTHSQGDFNAIQEAIDALPEAGGEICLLPGRHRGPIDLSGRRDIRISGCGPRSIVELTATEELADRPGIRLDRAERISFTDFAVEARDLIAFGAAARCQAISLTRLRVIAAGPRSAAVLLERATDVMIERCQMRASMLPRALEPSDIEALLPLVYLAGRDLMITGCDFGAEMQDVSRNRVALGGLQIGGSSANVRITANRIAGGNGHGITLGSVETETIGTPGLQFRPMRPWLTLDADGCVKQTPGGTQSPDAPETTRQRISSAGPLEEIDIHDNDIRDHGGCGISVAHWFIARRRPGAPRTPPVAAVEAWISSFDGMDDIEITELRITRNRILGCMALGLANALHLDAAFNSGYGGITLAAVADLRISDNEIRGCGTATRSPICGIYLRSAERLRITDNRISENGRTASLTDPLLVGNLGGIVIGHVDGSEPALGVGLRDIPAAVISGNVVVSPEGRALEMTGTGPMIVQSNSLTAHGNNLGGVLLMLLAEYLAPRDASVGTPIAGADVEGQFRAALSQIGGSAVLVLNTGMNRNIALWSQSASAIAGNPDVAGLPPVERAARDEGARSLRLHPRGPVAFSDNKVTFDAFSNAITLSLCSVAILSLDDVGMHDNHCAVDLGFDFVLINALVVGALSVRVQGNKFREILSPALVLRQDGLPTTLFSAVTAGILNATENNQGTHCFLVLGVKKPEVEITGVTGATARLRTNRQLLQDEHCARFNWANG